MTSFRLHFVETRRYNITVDADNPTEAEEEVREHWESYSVAYRPGGSVVSLAEVAPADARHEVLPDTDEPSF